MEGFNSKCVEGLSSKIKIQFENYIAGKVVLYIHAQNNQVQ